MCSVLDLNIIQNRTKVWKCRKVLHFQSIWGISRMACLEEKPVWFCTVIVPESGGRNGWHSGGKNSQNHKTETTATDHGRTDTDVWSGIPPDPLWDWWSREACRKIPGHPSRNLHYGTGNGSRMLRGTGGSLGRSRPGRKRIPKTQERSGKTRIMDRGNPQHHAGIP